MICSKCGKRPAVVFVSVNKDDANPKGYCLTCAKELGIKPVEDLINKMGLNTEDLEAMEDQMNSMMENMNEVDMSEMLNAIKEEGLVEQMRLDDFQNDAADKNDDSFSPGGASTFPAFFNNFFGGGKGGDSASQGSAKQNKKQEIFSYFIFFNIR